MKRGFLQFTVLLPLLASPSLSRGALTDEHTNAVLPKVEIIAGDVAYCRIGSVSDSVAEQTRAAYQAISSSTNKLKGLVIDLRFADGSDFAAAAATADLFTARERPLLDFGSGVVKSTAKSDAIPGPIAILINGETRGAAEALAATLHRVDDGLVIGNPTAAATNSPAVKLGDGSELTRIEPDISVMVSLQDERERFDNPYMVKLKSDLSATNSSATNRSWSVIERISEADLVRAKANGADINNLSEDDLASVRSAEPAPPTIRDPALARAVDFIKGLAALHL